AGLSLAGHRGPPAADQLPAGAARRRPPLPLPAAVDAAGRRDVAPAALRPGRQLQPLRRQGGPSAARRAPRLLLLHAHALRLAHAHGLLRAPARSASAGMQCIPALALRAGGPLAGGLPRRPAPLGPAHRPPPPP